MTVIMIIMFFLLAQDMRIAEPNKFHADYCDANRTNSLRGIFTVIIFTSHFREYIVAHESDALTIAIVNFLGQLMVAPFLFYSGFGVAESIQKKGMQYVKKLPVQRALKTLVHCDLVVLAYIALSKLLGGSISLSEFFLSLICWTNVDNSTWYVFAIVVLYLFTAVSFLLYKKNKYIATALVSILSVALVLILRRTKPMHWHNTLMCYAFGMWYSLMRDKVEKIVMSNDLMYLCTLLGAFLAFYYANKYCDPYQLEYHLCAILFMILVVIISMKARFDNSVLRFLGKHTLGIYLLQRIPMIYLSGIESLHDNTAVFYIVCFMVTCILSLLYDRIYSVVDRVIFLTVGEKCKSGIETSKSI